MFIFRSPVCGGERFSILCLAMYSSGDQYLIFAEHQRCCFWCGEARVPATSERSPTFFSFPVALLAKRRAVARAFPAY